MFVKIEIIMVILQSLKQIYIVGYILGFSHEYYIANCKTGFHAIQR